MVDFALSSVQSTAPLQHVEPFSNPGWARLSPDESFYREIWEVAKEPAAAQP